MIKISASILTSYQNSPEQINKTITQIETAGVPMLHLDVMDGMFVPPTTFDYNFIKTVQSEMIFDTHLMVNHPEKVIPQYAKVGSGNISFHLESGCDVPSTVKAVQGFGIKAGIAVNPKTPVEELFPFLGIADLFLIMSVQPGYGGQVFIPESLAKISKLRSEAENRGLTRNRVIIEVDGGINDKNASDIIKAGADILVTGAWLTTSKDIAGSVRKLCSNS